MTGMMHGLDQPCPTCQRILGDHTVRGWAECMGTPTSDLPFEPIPDDVLGLTQEGLRKRFGLDEDLLVADTVTTKAVVFEGEIGVIKVRTPGLLHEFSVGRSDGPPLLVCKLLYLASPDGIRRYGKLVRDSTNGAANAAEGKRR